MVWSDLVDLGVDIFQPVPSKNSYESQNQVPLGIYSLGVLVLFL